MFANLRDDGTIKIPDAIIDRLELQPGDEVIFLKSGSNYLLFKNTSDDLTDEQRLAYARFVREESKGIMDKLTRITLEDEIYSEEEIYLCNVIAEKIFEYQEYLNKVLIKNIITVDEYTEIKNYKSKIIEMARSTANRDDHISIDEKKILDSLIKIINDLN